MIKQATPDDFGDVLRLYKASLDEMGETYEEVLLLNKIVTCYYLAPCFLVVIDGKITGMAGLTLVSAPHNGGECLADYMFYIEPEHRNIRTLDALMETIKGFAVERKLPIRLDFISKGDNKARIKLLERYGFNIHAIVGVYGEK